MTIAHVLHNLASDAFGLVTNGRRIVKRKEARAHGTAKFRGGTVRELSKPNVLARNAVRPSEHRHGNEPGTREIETADQVGRGTAIAQQWQLVGLDIRNRDLTNKPIARRMSLPKAQQIGGSHAALSCIQARRETNSGTTTFDGGIRDVDRCTNGFANLQSTHRRDSRRSATATGHIDSLPANERRLRLNASGVIQRDNAVAHRKKQVRNGLVDTPSAPNGPMRDTVDLGNLAKGQRTATTGINELARAVRPSDNKGR